jgi:hypothetical protein
VGRQHASRPKQRRAQPPIGVGGGVGGGQGHPPHQGQGQWVHRPLNRCLKTAPPQYLSRGGAHGGGTGGLGLGLLQVGDLVGDLVGALVGPWWVIWRGLVGSPSGGTGGAVVVVPGDGVEDVGWRGGLFP